MYIESIKRMIFWFILVVTIIVILSVAWLGRQHIIPFLNDCRISNRPSFVYWSGWFLIAILISLSISYAISSDVNGSIPSWIALLLLLGGVGYSISRGFHLGVTTFLLIIIILLLAWMIIEFGITTTSAVLLIPVIIWFIVVLVAIIKKMIGKKS